MSFLFDPSQSYRQAARPVPSLLANNQTNKYWTDAAISTGS